MIADFYDTFDETPDKGSDIPEEVLNILSEDLPSTFMYYRNEKGEYMAGPRPEYQSDAISIKVDIDENFVNEYLKDIPKNKWSEYIYRMQLTVPIKNIRIGDKEKQIPIENTLGNPLSDSVELQKTFMYPEPFPPAREFEFETAEGEKILISIVRKPYSSLDSMLFTNINFPALQMNFIVADDGEKSKMTYTIKPAKADSVSDALAAIHLFDGLRNGSAKINGEKISKAVSQKGNFDLDKWSSAIDFWTTAKKLEDILEVSFVPNAEFPMEDVEFFSQLETCLLHDKMVVWEHPFDHFHVSGMAFKNGQQYEDIIGKEGGEFVFQEGPISATLLGTAFELYSQTRLADIVITNIVWDDEKQESGEVYVSDPIGGKWKLYRKYRTKKQIILDADNE